VAVPVGSPETCEALREEAERVLCLVAPEWLFAIGEFYGDFSPTTDDEVRELLARAAREGHAPDESARR